MEEIHGQRAVLKVVAEDVGVIVLPGGGGALLFLKLVNGGELVAQLGGSLEALALGCLHHARGERPFQLGVAAFQQQSGVAHRAGINLRRGKLLDAGAEAAMNVVLQAGALVVAGEIDLATGNEKAAMDQLDDAPSQVAGKVWAVVGRAVLQQPPRHEDLGEAVPHRQLDVGIAFVVLEQNVEARLALLDQVGFERQRLGLVADQDVFQINGLAHQRARFGVGLRRLQQVRANARAQVLGLAHVDHRALGVLVEVDAGLRGQSADFLVKVHGRARWPVSRIAGTASSS